MTLLDRLRQEREAYHQGDIRGPIRISYFVVRVVAALVFCVAFGLLLVAAWGKL